MAKEGLGSDVAELRERVARMEVKLEELSKRIDSFSKYARDLYDYLQKTKR